MLFSKTKNVQDEIKFLILLNQKKFEDCKEKVSVVILEFILNRKVVCYYISVQI